MKKTATGSVYITTDAQRAPQSVYASSMNSLNPTQAVLVLAPDKTSAYRSSCQGNMNDMKAAVNKPGSDTGKIILIIADNLEHPSIMAASSNSHGVDINHPLKNHITNGIVRERLAKINER